MWNGGGRPFAPLPGKGPVVYSVGWLCFAFGKLDVSSFVAKRCLGINHPIIWSLTLKTCDAARVLERQYSVVIIFFGLQLFYVK